MTLPNGATVVVVDDHSLVAGALAMALRGRGIGATAVEPGAISGLVAAPAPAGGLILLDLDLGSGLDGAELVPRLRRAGWRVLVVTGSRDEARIATAVASGALGWVSKSAPFDELVDAAARAATGHSLLTDGERARLQALATSSVAATQASRDRWERLTPRERQIVDRIVLGRRPRVIAEEFVVSVATVRTHIRSILAKLEVGSQLEVAALARQRGLRGGPD
jgi:DNA-binding NarL/FixJ family response regulator